MFKNLTYFSQSPFMAAFSVSAILFCGSAEAATYYVDFKDGSDFATGASTSSPWKRAPGDPLATGLAKATKLVAGDKVVFRGGVSYHGYVSTNRFSGTAGKPIQYVGNEWGNGRAIISGSNPVNSVTSCTSQATCGNNPNWQKLSIVRFTTSNPEIRLFTTEGMLYESQHPKMQDIFYSDNAANYITLPVADTAAFEKGSLKSAALANLLGGTVEDTKINYWVSPNVIARVDVNSIIGDTINFTPKVDSQRVQRPLQRGRAILSFVNSPALIDGPGQYASLADNKTAIAWLPKPNTEVFVGAKRRAGFGFTGGGSYLSVNGFTFQHFDTPALVSSGRFSNIVVSNNVFTESSMDGNDRIAPLSNITDLAFSGNTISNIQKGGGLAVSNVTNGVLSNNSIKRLHYTGMLLMDNTNLVVNNNTISDVNGTHGNGVAIYLDNQNVRFENNTITDSIRPVTFHGRTPTVVNNITIANNFLESTTNYPISSWGNTNNVSIFGNVLMGNRFGLLVNNSDANLKITNNFISSEQGIALNRGAGPGYFTKANLLTPLTSPETLAVDSLITSLNTMVTGKQPLQAFISNSLNPRAIRAIRTKTPGIRLPNTVCNSVAGAEKIGAGFSC